MSRIFLRPRETPPPLTPPSAPEILPCLAAARLSFRFVIHAGPDGAVAWSDSLHFVVTESLPWHRAQSGVRSPNLNNMAVIVAKAGSLPKARLAEQCLFVAGGTGCRPSHK